MNIFAVTHQKSMRANVTIEQAMTRGYWLLRMIPLLLFIAVAIAFVALVNNGVLPTFAYAFLLPINVLVTWLWWSIAVTHWRIWALEHVRDINQLFERAEHENLIWRKGSWFERTEIRTSQQRSLLEGLSIRLHTPDAFTDDPEVPPLTEIRFSLFQVRTAVAIGIGVIVLGIYAVVAMNMHLVGAALIGTVLLVIPKEVRQLRDRRPQLVLGNTGMGTVNAPLQPWSSIHNERVVLKGSGSTARHLLCYEHDGGSEELNFDMLEINKERLRHLLRVYRNRSALAVTSVQEQRSE